MYEYGWPTEDWHRKGAGQTIGHLIECAGYVTGAHFADPPYRIVPGLTRLGFPIAEIAENGEAVITKVEGTGGLVSVNTCKAQLVYELHDPASYLTPDVTVDVRDVRFEQVGPDLVKVRGATGRVRPEQLKVLVGIFDSYVWEGEVTYSGTIALNCAKLAEDSLRERIAATGVEKDIEKYRFDYIGLNSANQDATPKTDVIPYELRLRFAGLTKKQEVAELMAQEVEWLFMGPNGSGGVRKSTRPVVGMYSAFIPRDKVKPEVALVGVN